MFFKPPAPNYGVASGRSPPLRPHKGHGIYHRMWQHPIPLEVQKLNSNFDREVAEITGIKLIEKTDTEYQTGKKTFIIFFKKSVWSSKTKLYQTTFYKIKNKKELEKAYAYYIKTNLKRPTIRPMYTFFFLNKKPNCWIWTGYSVWFNLK